MLEISETFFSVQGEGLTTGVPSYFVRLKGCNLRCGFFAQEITSLTKSMKDTNEYVVGGNLIGGLQKEGKATWTCDSAPVWVKGVATSNESLVDRWRKEGVLDNILSGNIHIIWTGGEPTIPKHQKSITEFNDYLEEYCVKNKIKNNTYQEIETNGTIPLEFDLLKYIDQINCSVKLSNSGMTDKQRINPKAIDTICNSNKLYSFKFVVSTEEDIKEAIKDYINPFNIELKNTCMMPGLDKQEDFHERSLFIFEMSKKYLIRGLQRMHISAWGSCTGV